MGNEIDTPKLDGSKKTLQTFTGRTPIYTDERAIDARNIVKVLDECVPQHHVNAMQVDYLWNYYKGVQPILDRVKDVRPEINNKVVVNHAQEIVAFKIGYQLAEPLQYTGRNYGIGQAEADNPKLDDINDLNNLMASEDKDSCDRDLFEWMCVGGIGYRMGEADGDQTSSGGDAPFSMYSLDPRLTFIVYTSDYRHVPLMGVVVGRSVSTGRETYSCYTAERLYRVEDGRVTNGGGEGEPHTYGCVPIVEYKLNNARMGVFEPVLPLLDAINSVESNRLDGIEQTVQALMKFVNCSITETEFKEMLALGAVEVSTTEGAIGNADVGIIRNDLDQTSTQVTKDDLYRSIINICGMPNHTGSDGSSSDTGAAVLLRNGWVMAESHAKSYELQFKRSERQFLRLVLAICEQSGEVHIDLKPRDIELCFNRRNYENILAKSQVLTTMLANDWVHPQLAYEHCGMFSDPEAAYLQSAKWHEENLGGMGVEPPSPVSVGSQATVPEPNGNPTA